MDDNEDAALALATYLSLLDIQARAVFGGAEAIDMAREWTPHVVLMDISMPHCDGFQAARALRQYPRTAAMAIVAHTALDEFEVRRHLTGAEFDGYFQKAQSIDELVRLVWELVE
ncbi:response regulator [Paraburkholderia strydomiana]|uniref:response regulator n=1 Tax=Paraburkholderia strydomiana TaxID=1245417 RepID=UPI003336EE29